jgi:ubiquinol-cytochrome c reductase cytochrome b subunit
MSVLKTAGSGFANRFRVVGWVQKSLKKVFPDHWSFFLGELALYSFIILVITGTYLAFFFKPSLALVHYHGSYTKLTNLEMSEAYDSTLQISFDVRGGLLVRQIHHWAALIFVAAIGIHMIRIFLTGAFRRPREVNWMIGVMMFALAAAEGFLGYSLPDDDLSGTGLRIAASVVESIPVIGTYLMFFLFGGQFPGTVWVHRFYIMHVFIIPGLLTALIGAHLAIIWHQGHTQWPGKKQRENNEVGDPMFPVFMAKTGALFLFVFGVIAALATFFQINPVWLWGPYSPAIVSSNSQPDWYIGFMEGSLRLMPGVVSNVGGHTFVWNVFIPAVLLPAGFFILAGLYPIFEEWLTGDLRHHQILDRPRNAPNRTALGIAVIAMGGDLLAAGGDDVITNWLNLNLFDVVWFFRIGFFVFPVMAYLIAKHVCLAMQRSDRHRLRAGTEFGIASQAGGGYTAVSRTISEEQRTRMEAHRPEHLIAPIPRHLIPLPTPRRIRAQIRARLNHFYTLNRLETRYGRGQMELAEFNPPERSDGSVWSTDGGKPPSARAAQRADGHPVNGHSGPAAQASEASSERPDGGDGDG